MKVIISIVVLFMLSSCLSTSNAKNSDKLSKVDTDLINAILNKDYELTKKQLKLGANPNVKSHFMIDKMVEHFGVESTKKILNVSSEEELRLMEHSALNIAIFTRQNNIVKLLLDNKADANELVGSNTLLFVVVSLRDIEILKTMLDNGADPDKGYMVKQRGGFIEKMNLVEYAEDVCYDMPEIEKMIQAYLDKKHGVNQAG